MSKRKRSKTNWNNVIAFSLIANIILGLGLVLVVHNNLVLNDQMKSLVERDENLTRNITSLNQECSMLENQLDYYKQQAEYYSGLLDHNETSEGFIGQASINIVAVKQVTQDFFEIGYEGVAMKVNVEMENGEGRLLIDTQPRVGIDLQTSAKTSLLVVENFTGISLRKTDVILTVISEKDVEIVDGPSAGAAITIAILAAILDKEIENNIVITGTINPDGTIGPVGGLAEKAIAAYERGVKTLLVPKGQNMVTVYTYEVHEPVPGFSVRVSKPEQVMLEDYLKDNGYEIKIDEVENIEQAYELIVH
ncbi:S16 family serine protease [[Eubacterium] cellulosolvens]